MKRARIKFKGRVAELVEESKAFWHSEVARHQGVVYSFNGAQGPEKNISAESSSPINFNQVARVIKEMIAAKAGEEEIIKLYDDASGIQSIRKSAVTAWGQRIYPVVLSLSGFALVKKLQEEFGSDLIRGGYAAGSVPSGEAVEGSDIDMHIHFGEGASDRIMAAAHRLDELERALVNSLQETGVNITHIYDHKVNVIRSVPGVGTANIEELVKQGIQKWLAGEARDEVKRLLADLMGPAASSPVEDAQDDESLERIFDQRGLDNYSRDLWKTFLRLYRNPSADRPKLIIKTRNNQGNFYPSALLTEDQRRDLLGAQDYETIVEEMRADEAKRVYEIRLGNLDAGLGTSLERESYVKKFWGRNELGAKGTDLGFEGIYGEKIVSVAEVKLLRLIQEVQRREYHGKVVFQPIVSDDSKPSYETLLERPYLPDLLEGKLIAEARSYKQILDESGIEVRMQVAPFYPSLDAQTKEVTYARESSASHGEWGFKYLRGALDHDYASEESNIVVAFYNGDGTNNMPDRYIVEWMLKRNVPLAMVSTTKTGIDRKGGMIGVEFLADGKVTVRMLELNSAKNNQQETVFQEVGLKGGEGEEGAQYQYQHRAYQLRLLAKILQDLRK